MSKQKFTTKWEFRVMTQGLATPWYCLSLYCFDEDGNVITHDEPIIAERSIENLRDTLAQMQQALDMGVMDENAPERL